MARLAELHEETRNESDSTKTTEFPVLDWFRRAWDGVILLWWVGGGIFVVFGFLGGIFIYGIMEAFATCHSLRDRCALFLSYLYLVNERVNDSICYRLPHNVESIRRKRN